MSRRDEISHAKARTTQMVAIADIEAGERLRRVNPDRVTALAERIAAEGLLMPIGLTLAPGAPVHRLVFGAHRLAACAALGWSEIEAFVGNEADADVLQLREIAENVERFELTVLDRAVNIAAWRAIHERRFGKVKRGPKKAISPTVGLINDAAREIASETFANAFSEAAQEAFGLSRTQIFNALRIASIAPDVREALAFHRVADSTSNLLLLADQSPERQRRVAELLTGNEADSVHEACALIDHVPTPERPGRVDKVMSQFDRLHPSEQRRFFERYKSTFEVWLLEKRK